MSLPLSLLESADRFFLGACREKEAKGIAPGLLRSGAFVRVRLARGFSGLGAHAGTRPGPDAPATTRLLGGDGAGGEGGGARGEGNEEIRDEEEEEEVDDEDNTDDDDDDDDEEEEEVDVEEVGATE